MQCIGYSASDYEGKRYLKLTVLEPVQEGRGEGLDTYKVQADPKVEAKIKGQRFPININITGQDLNRRLDKNNRELVTITITDIEVVAPPRATAS